MQRTRPIDKLFQEVAPAAHAIWNNDFDTARQFFRSKAESIPRYALELAIVSHVQQLMSSTTEKRQALLDEFQKADNLATAAKYSEPILSFDKKEVQMEEKTVDAIAKARSGRKEAARAMEKVEKEHYDFSWQVECDCVYTEAILIRAGLQLAINSYVKGALNLRKAWGMYYEMVQKVEKDAENGKFIPPDVAMNIKCGAGAFYCYLALVPSGLMKVLSAIGFISDKELGEQYLTEVIFSNTIRSPTAALMLLTYYLFLPTAIGDVNTTLAKAKLILDRMDERYPANTYFYAFRNFYHRKKGEVKEALISIQKSIANAKGTASPLLKYVHGDTLYMDMQWEAARDMYEDLLVEFEETGEAFAYTGQVALSLAGCAVMQRDYVSGMEWIRRVGSMFNPKSKQDEDSPRIAAKVVAQPKLLPLIGVYVLYINRDLAHMQKAHAERLLASMEEATAGCDLSSPDVRGLFYLFRAVILKGCRDAESAMSLLRQVVASERAMGKIGEELVMPFALYELGELEYRAGHHDDAKKLLEKGSKMISNCHETLKNRYNIALKQLKENLNAKAS